MQKTILITMSFFGFIFMHSQTNYIKNSILFKPSNTEVNSVLVHKSNTSLVFDDALVIFDNYNFNETLHKELNASILSLYTFGDLFDNSYSITTKGLYKPISKYAVEGYNEAVFFKRGLPKELKLLYR